MIRHKSREELKYPFSNGGEHKIFGTHNRLFRLDDVYLEVIAINPLTLHYSNQDGLTR